MIVHILRGCGLDPAYVVGGELRDTGANAGWGTGEWIVVEADESDRSLLALAPEIAVLTNAELDHHSTYSSRLDLEQTLREFMGRAEHGAVVWDRPELLALCPDGALAYDATDTAMSPRGSRFHWRGIEVSLAVPGAHNAVNAAGALDRLGSRGSRPGPGSRRARRLSRRATALRADRDHERRRCRCTTTMRTIRPRWPRRSPRPGRSRRRGWSRCSSRTCTRARERWRREFGVALAGADLVVVLAVYPARERAEDFPGVDGHLVAAAAADAAAGRTVAWLPSFEDAGRFLSGALREGDLCLVMGAGDVDSLARSLVE